MTQEQINELKEGISKILEQDIGSENSEHTRGSIRHSIMGLIWDLNLDERFDVKVECSWRELPWYKILWYYFFKKEEMKKLKESLDIYINSYNIPTITTTNTVYTNI